MLPSYHVDPSPLWVADGVSPVASTVACGADGVLGAAVVVSSRKGGTMVWGHASLRIVGCVDGEVYDLEYETYRLGAWNEDLLRQEHVGQPYADGPYFRSQRGALVLFRNQRPVDAGWYRDLANENRELWEVWLRATPDELTALADAAADWYDEQRSTFLGGRDLPERYVPWQRNCTAVLRDLRPDLDPGSALPFAWLRALEDEASLRVVHPSVHLLATLPPGTDQIERRHVTFRTHRPVSPVGWSAEAVGPWTSVR